MWGQRNTKSWEVLFFLIPVVRDDLHVFFVRISETSARPLVGLPFSVLIRMVKNMRCVGFFLHELFTNYISQYVIVCHCLSINNFINYNHLSPTLMVSHQLSLSDSPNIITYTINVITESPKNVPDSSNIITLSANITDSPHIITDPTNIMYHRFTKYYHRIIKYYNRITDYYY